MGVAQEMLAASAVALLTVGAAGCGSASLVKGSSNDRADTSASTGRATAAAHLNANQSRLMRWDHDGDFGPQDGESPHSPFDADDSEVRYFGHPAGRDERRAIASLVGNYYAAAANHDSRAACSMLDPVLVAGLSRQPRQAQASSAGNTSGCTATLSQLLAHPPGRSPADLATTKVIGVRVRGGEALALLRLRDSSTRDLPLLRERGTWKIDAFFDNGLK